MRRYAWYSAGLLALVATPAAAQKSFGGQFYGGVPVPLGTTDDYVGPKFSWGGGVWFSKPAAPWALRFDIRNSRFDADQEIFAGHAIVDDGYARTWDFALTGEIGMRRDKPFRIYALAGVGYYNRYVALTDAQLVSGCYWDPWWGYICGSGVGDVIIADKSDWDFGFNFGGGLSYQMSNGASLFLEAVYNTVNFASGDANQGNNPSKATTWMPIVFGIKF